MAGQTSIDIAEAHEIRSLLDEIGIERFLRFRKRFFEPGIRSEILCFDPELNPGQVDRVVQAGRRIVRRGFGLTALALAKGRPVLPDVRTARPPRRDGYGQSFLVAIGGLGIVGYIGLAVAGFTVSTGDEHDGLLARGADGQTPTLTWMNAIERPSQW